jgi:hypothetical protein
MQTNGFCERHPAAPTRFIPKGEVAEFIDMVRRGRREIAFEHPIHIRSGELTQLAGVVGFVIRGTKGHVHPKQMGRLEREISLIRRQLQAPDFRLEQDMQLEWPEAKWRTLDVGKA